MKIKMRILILSTIAWLGLIIIAAIGINNSLGDAATIKNIATNSIPKAESLLIARGEVYNLSRRNYESIAMEHLPYAEQVTNTQRIVTRKKIAETALQQALDTYDKLPRLPEADITWGKFKDVYARWKPAMITETTQYMEQGLAGGTQESLNEATEKILHSSTAARDDTNALNDLLDQLVDTNKKFTDAGITEAEESSSRALILQIVISAVLIALAIFLGMTTLKAVVKPIEIMRDAVTLIERESDLVHRVDYAASDEVGEMVVAFNSMVGRLQSSVKSIQKSVNQVNTEVAAFSEAAAAVATGSKTQSANTSSMAASVEQMTVSISSVSNNATDAQQMAQEAGEISNLGSQVIEKTSSEMNAMVAVVAQTSQVIQARGEESRQISSVVQVIKDVADQTNLLALNAAIEAARAGDQGRGFAVVADEVRKLAERTAKSIDDITAMINKIQASANEAVEEMDKVVRQVEQGQKLTQEAGEKMHTISDQSSKVSEAIDEISNALKEQSLASQDIARNVESIAQMTDKNSDSANNAAKGAKKLTQLSSDVKSTLDRFRA